jgi:hypothetical protein
MDKVEKPKEENCSFCGGTGHTINNCTIFLVIISSG